MVEIDNAMIRADEKPEAECFKQPVVGAVAIGYKRLRVVARYLATGSCGCVLTLRVLLNRCKSASAASVVPANTKLLCARNSESY